MTDEEPTAQAERLAQEIMAGDPRKANGMRSDTPDAPLDDWLGTPRHFGPSNDKWHGIV